MIFELTSQMLVLTLLVSGLPLVLSALSGLVVSVLQAATSVQDQTISYAAKLITLVAVLFICGNWFCSEVLELTRQSLGSIAFMGK